jgi:hypothetical protein
MVFFHAAGDAEELARFAKHAEPRQAPEQFAKHLLHAADGSDFAGVATASQRDVKQRAGGDFGEEGRPKLPGFVDVAP